MLPSDSVSCCAFRLYFCNYCRHIFVSVALGKSLLLARSDIGAGNSLSVPQLMAVRCHYPAFLTVYH